MSDPTKQALEQFVLQIIEAAKSGAEWTSIQTPLLVQEWLRWQLAEASIHLLLGVVALVVALWATRRAYRADWDLGPSVDNLGMAFLGGMGFFLSPKIIVNGLIIAKVLVAPRVVVFEKFMDLLK